MEEVIRNDGRYPAEAFGFLHEGLAHAVKDVYDQEAGEGGQHHVSGRQLCIALRDLAVQRWGMMARTVLARWNIHETIDFGKMVYLLIENGFMRKTEDDSIEHFRDVFDFKTAYDVKDEFELQE